MKPPLKTRPAQLHFMQTGTGAWTGSVIMLGHHIIDTGRRHRTIPKSLRPYCCIRTINSLAAVTYRVDYVAPSKSGPRHSDYDTLDRAMDAGRRWAGRRFRIVEEEQR